LEGDVKPNFLTRLFLLLGRLALAGVLLYAVYAKLDNPAGTFASFDPFRWNLAVAAFGIAISQYQVLPVAITETVAYLVMGIEFFLGLWLVTGFGLRWAAAGTSALLAFFFVLMTRAYLLGMTIDCGCFGPGDRLGPMSLARDAALLALALLVTAFAFRMARGSAGSAPAREIETAPVAAHYAQGLDHQ
jgi:uncharacterized membrane protein YphA (DoxX/SURF4 family)